MNPCTIAIWKCQQTGLLAKGFFHDGQMWVTGFEGQIAKYAFSSDDPADWDWWATL